MCPFAGVAQLKGGKCWDSRKHSETWNEEKSPDSWATESVNKRVCRAGKKT